MLPNPIYLTHPNIPKPLHGLNPRTIMGKEWWDDHRQVAYAKLNYRCWACGIHKQDAKYHKWLEGHEAYSINYKTGNVRLIEIVALCHSCHNFIHSGRMMAMLEKGQLDELKCYDILKHGMDILNKAKLKPYVVADYLWSYINGRENWSPSEDQWDILYGDVAGWNEWHIEIDGKKHYSKYKNYSEWKEAYS